MTNLSSLWQAHMQTDGNSQYMSQPVSYAQYGSQQTNVQRWLLVQGSFHLLAASVWSLSKDGFKMLRAKDKEDLEILLFMLLFLLF
jgi:hypothetical protein